MKKEIKFGKNIIGTLTEGMYENSRFIYREYIQNAADQIDQAVQDGLLGEGEGVIDIRIDPSKREITITDNATGIPHENVYEVLGNVAASTKDRTVQKGFRGIGRLGGLGYCKKLVFETSAYGDPCKTIMTWDAAALKQFLNDRKVTLNAIEVIQMVTEITTVPCSENEHFFTVRLEHINETNELLLNVDDIKEYLSLIAPVPFNQGEFYLARKIYDYIDEEKLPSLDEYNIRINGEQIFKGYKLGIHQLNSAGGSSRIDEIKDIAFQKFYGNQNQIIAWCWFGISNFEKAIPERGNPHRSIRLRKSNIQIGEESALDHLHKEKGRGNHYFVGELYALDPELIPNSSRSYFNENTNSKKFEQEVCAFFQDTLYRLYYAANGIKNAFKSITEAHELAKTIHEKATVTGFSSETEKERLYKKHSDAGKKATEGQRKIDKFSERLHDEPLIAKVFHGIEENYGISSGASPAVVIPEGTSNDKKKTDKKFRTDKLAKLPREQRRFLGNIFDIIIKALPPDMAEALICKIEEEYK